MRSLVECGASLDVTNHQESTPLHSALYKRHIQCAMFLLHSGAEIDVQDKVICQLSSV